MAVIQKKNFVLLAEREEREGGRKMKGEIGKGRVEGWRKERIKKGYTENKY